MSASDKTSLTQIVSTFNAKLMIVTFVFFFYHRLVSSAESLQPWVGLTVSRKVDSALEDVSLWYMLC